MSPRQTALSPTPTAEPPKILGPTTELQTLCRTHFIDEILICMQVDHAHHRQTILEVISDARDSGVGVRVIPDLYDGLAWGAHLDYLGDFPTLTVVHRTIPAFALALKRAMDILGSAAALLLLSPLLLLLALIVKLDSRGPIFYASSRLGRKGRPFPCYKFRTMVVGADAQIANPSTSTNTKACSSKSPTIRASPESAASSANTSSMNSLSSGTSCAAI